MKIPSKSKKALWKFNRAIGKSKDVLFEQVREQYDGLKKLLALINPSLYKKEITELKKKLDEERAKYAEQEREYQIRETQLRAEIKATAFDYQNQIERAGKDFGRREELMKQRISELEKQLASTHQLYLDSQTLAIREGERAGNLLKITEEQAEHISALQSVVYHLTDKTFRNGLAGFFQRVFRRENGLLMAGTDLKIIRGSGSALVSLGYAEMDFMKDNLSVEEILCEEDRQIFRDCIYRLNTREAKGFQYEAGLKVRGQTIEGKASLLSPFCLRVSADYSGIKREETLAILWINLTRPGTTSNYNPKAEVISLKKDQQAINRDFRSYIHLLDEMVKKREGGYVLDFKGMNDLSDDQCMGFCTLLSDNKNLNAININSLSDRQYSFFKYTGLGAERLGFAKPFFLNVASGFLVKMQNHTS